MTWVQWLRKWLGIGQQPFPPAKEATKMSETFDSRVLMEQVKAALTEMNWKYGEDPERPALLMGSSGRHGFYFCVLQLHPEQPLVLFYTHVQSRVPEEKRAAAAELLARLNYGMWLGNFEMDCSDGEIRYKTSLHLADGELTTEMLGTMIRANLSTIDRYLPAIMSVLWNDVAAEDAVGLVESV
jgi:hypothetical protein